MLIGCIFVLETITVMLAELPVALIVGRITFPDGIVVVLVEVVLTIVVTTEVLSGYEPVVHNCWVLAEASLFTVIIELEEYVIEPTLSVTLSMTL